MEKKDEENWPLKNVIFVEDIKTVPIGKVLKVSGVCHWKRFFYFYNSEYYSPCLPITTHQVLFDNWDMHSSFHNPNANATWLLTKIKVNHR